MLEKLLESAYEHAASWKPMAGKFLEGIKEIDDLLKSPITGKDLINIMTYLDADDDDIMEVKMKLSASASKVNNGLCFRFAKTKMTDGVFSVGVVVDGSNVIKDFDSYIQAKVEDLFKKLNESKNENRFHKGICLRRDVARLRCVLDEPPRAILLKENLEMVDVSIFSEISPSFDYIDTPLDFTFLEEDRKSRPFAVDESISSGRYLFCAADDILRMKLKLLIREAFVKRLALFD